jgi:hypothetical protein
MNAIPAGACIAAAALQAARQLYSTLSEIRCRRATTATLPPLASTSASSADFSVAVHFWRRSTRAMISTSAITASFWSNRRPLQRTQDSEIQAGESTRDWPDAYDRAPDTEIIARAATDKRTSITADLDYPRRLALSRATEPSPVLFRVRIGQRPP